MNGLFELHLSDEELHAALVRVKRIFNPISGAAMPWAISDVEDMDG